MGRFATCFGNRYLYLRASASIILAERNYAFVQEGAAVVLRWRNEGLLCEAAHLRSDCFFLIAAFTLRQTTPWPLSGVRDP